MEKKSVKVFLILVLVLGAIVFFQLRRSSADANKFNGVMPFMTPSGLMGFFNQKRLRCLSPD